LASLGTRSIEERVAAVVNMFSSATASKFLVLEAPAGFGKSFGFAVYAGRYAKSETIVYGSPYHLSLSEVAANLILQGRRVAYFTGITVPGQFSWCPVLREEGEAPFRVEHAAGLPISVGCLYRCKFGWALRDALTYYFRDVKKVEWLADEIGGDARSGKRILSSLETALAVIPRSRMPSVERKLEEFGRSGLIRASVFFEGVTSAEERAGVPCVAPIISAFPHLLRGRVVLITHAYASSPTRLVSLLASTRGDHTPMLVLDEFDSYFLEPDFLPRVPENLDDRVDAEASFLSDLESRLPSLLSRAGGEVRKIADRLRELGEYLSEARGHRLLDVLRDPEGAMSKVFEAGTVFMTVSRNKIPVMESDALGLLHRLMLVPEIHDLYLDHVGDLRGQSATSFFYSLFGDVKWPPPEKFGVDDYKRKYFLRLDDRGEPRLATHEERPQILLGDYPVRKRMVMLSATAAQRIGDRLPFLIYRERDTSYTLYSELTDRLWGRLFYQSLTWETPKDVVRFVLASRVTPFNYTTRGIVEVLSGYLSVIDEYLVTRPYDKLILCQNKAVAELVYERLYPRMYMPEDSELWNLPSHLVKRLGFGKPGLDYYYGLMKDARHPHGFKQVFVTWMRSRLTRGARINAVIDTVIVVGSPYSPPTTVSPFRPTDATGKSPSAGTAAAIPYGDTGLWLVHTSADAYKAISDLIQAVSRPLRNVDAILSGEEMRRRYRGFNLRIVVPKYMYDRLLVFAPEWVRKLLEYA